MDRDGDFTLFQKEFKKYQELFQLSGYNIYFRYEPIDDSLFANITVDQEDMAATVRFNSRLAKDLKPYRNPGWEAKHEAVHLLISRLHHYGNSRYITRADTYEAAEELVNKLVNLIKE